MPSPDPSYTSSGPSVGKALPTGLGHAVLLDVEAPTRRGGTQLLKKLNQSALRWLLLLMLMGILGWYGWLRVWKLHTHATTIDDIGVANNYLLAEHTHSIDSLRTRLYTPGKSHHYDSYTFGAMRLMDRIGVLEPGHLIFNYLFKAVANSRYGNYAPMQFLAGAWLVTSNETYNELKFWGRLPSAIASILLLALVPLVARRLSRNHFSTVPLLAMVLIACSWQQYFIARQMYPIAIGGLALLILIWRITYVCTYRVQHPNAWVEGLLLTGLCLCNYQLFYFIPGYLVVLLFYANNTAPTSWRIRHALKSTIYFTLFITPFLLSFDLSTEASNHWNAGRWGEYHFSLPDGIGWVDGAKYMFRFWVLNTHQVVAASLGFMPWSTLMQVLGLVWLGLAGLGLYYYATTNHAITHGFTLFVMLSILTWILMIATGVTNLSPTRQTSIMAPVMALLAANGFCISVRRLNIWLGFAHRQDALTLAVVTLASLGIISSHTLYFRYMRYEWSDPYIGARQVVNNLVRTYPTRLLIQCQWTLNGSLLWAPDRPINVLTFNRISDFKNQHQQHDIHKSPVMMPDERYCFVLSTTKPSPAWRKALTVWLRQQNLITEDFSPIILAQHQIMRNQYAEYVPISSLNPVGSSVLLVQLKPTKP